MNPRPTVQLRLADAGDLHMTWRWLNANAAYGTGYSPPERIAEPLGELTEALPGSGSPERLRAAFAGALASPESELRLMRRLAEVLWPKPLTEQLRQANDLGFRALVRLQPSPRVAAVPWELLAVDDEGTRLLDLADFVTAAPISLRAGKAVSETSRRENVPTAATTVYVLDPAVPGVGRGAGLGSVLGDVAADPQLTAFAERVIAAGDAAPRVSEPVELFRRGDLDRDWLGERLRAGASRLFYVGHVTSAAVEGGQSEDARLHLACGADTSGLAEAVRGHRPLSAKDLLLGDLPSKADGRAGGAIWPAPPRVALIGCESGGDTRFAESFGLASAMLHNGAELVTAAKWILPTNLAFHRLGGIDPAERPLSSLIVAVDDAHAAADPIATLADWQRERLAAWRASGALADAPLLWAALTSIVL
ncbi:CHAT domain-containing protein [Stackebrandtia soli]